MIGYFCTSSYYIFKPGSSWCNESTRLTLRPTCSSTPANFMPGTWGTQKWLVAWLSYACWCEWDRLTRDCKGNSHTYKKLITASHQNIVRLHARPTQPPSPVQNIILSVSYACEMHCHCHFLWCCDWRYKCPRNYCGMWQLMMVQSPVRVPLMAQNLSCLYINFSVFLWCPTWDIMTLSSSVFTEDRMQQLCFFCAWMPLIVPWLGTFSV